MSNKKSITDTEYVTIIRLDEYTTGEQCYTAIHPELPGCRGQGESPDEAEKDLALARELYIESLIEDEMAVPAPCIMNFNPIELTPIERNNVLVKAPEILELSQV